MKEIISLTNTEIKHLVSLHEVQARKKFRETIIEGMRAVATAYKAGMLFECIYVTKKLAIFAQENFPEVPRVLVTDKIMDKISTAVTPSGLLARVKIPAQPTTKLSSGIVLAEIGDPGNMGTLIRTAAACNIKTVVVISGTDPWSPKVIQASAGTIALVSIFQFTWKELLQAKHSLKLYGLVVQGGKAPSLLSSQSALLVVGSEAHGLPAIWQQECEELISLSMPGGTESLNAAIAGSIALYMLTQRN